MPATKGKKKWLTVITARHIIGLLITARHYWVTNAIKWFKGNSHWIFVAQSWSEWYTHASLIWILYRISCPQAKSPSPCNITKLLWSIISTLTTTHSKSNGPIYQSSINGIMHWKTLAFHYTKAKNTKQGTEVHSFSMKRVKQNPQWRQHSQEREHYSSYASAPSS